ncbi:MAG: FG-GAP-like repeat-containing protein [Bacteroidota bacterium]
MRLAILLFSLSLTNLLLAQFPNITWEYPLGAPAFGSSSAADLDGDGFYEIVFTTYTNDGKAHCLNAEDGSVKWTYDIGGCGDVAPLIYDVNQDDQLDVIINGSCNPTLFCINGSTGELMWSVPSGGGDSPPTVADMDQDGKPEILFGNFNGQIRVLNGEDGSVAKIIQAVPAGNALQTEPTLADINNDGKLDILGANFFNDNGLFVWAFDYESGDRLWTNEKSVPDADFHAYHGGAIADIDGDGLPEYVIGSGAGLLLAINLEDGSDLWTLELNASMMSAITIADMDQDGELEVIFNNNDYLTFDERIWVLNGADGTEEWSYPINFTSFRGMSVSDINGNGKLDLVSGHFMGVLRAVEPYTGLIWELNLREEFPNPDAFPWFETDHQPLIADFDQNGTTDVFAVAGYGTYEPDSLNTGRAFMIEAGEGTCPEWLMFRHDIRRTGFLPPEEVEEACAITNTETIEEQEREITIYPNPNQGAFQLILDMQESATVRIELRNTLGQLVTLLQETKLAAGEQELDISAPAGVTVGAYFLAIKVEQNWYYQRIVIQ